MEFRYKLNKINSFINFASQNGWLLIPDELIIIADSHEDADFKLTQKFGSEAHFLYICQEECLTSKSS